MQRMMRENVKAAAKTVSDLDVRMATKAQKDQEQFDKRLRGVDREIGRAEVKAENVKQLATDTREKLEQKMKTMRTDTKANTMSLGLFQKDIKAKLVKLENDLIEFSKVSVEKVKAKLTVESFDIETSQLSRESFEADSDHEGDGLTNSNVGSPRDMSGTPITTGGIEHG